MGNRRVRVMWCDLNGLSHGRYVPERRIHDHGHHAVTTLTMSIMRDLLQVDGYGADVGYCDLSTVPLAETRRTGWEVDTDVVIADLEYKGGPLVLAPRTVLRNAVESWRALGYQPMLGFEMEFYVMEPDESTGGWRPLTLPGHRVYGVGAGGDNTGLTFDFFDAAEASGLDVEGIMAEFHPGQMELNMRFGPALDSADRAFICKEMTRELAAAKGYKVTYLGRPHPELVGSGLHINFSLAPLNGEGNAFDDPAGLHGLSPLARHCLGGLIDHHEGIAALSAPLINSYRRLTPGLLAGYWANWGLDNRVSTYRIPYERGWATRIENRMPCGTANPYLAAAVMLEAARLGLQHGAECGDPQVGDGDTEPNTARHTPLTLEDALTALQADEELCAALNPDVIKAYVTIRQHEVDAFAESGNSWLPEEVTDWEIERFLPFY